ncbi:MAG: FAD binding domain-containing protein, partial [Acidimicrobiales bacterium]
LLTEIRLPKMGGAGWSYQKFNRRAQDWAIVGVAAVGASAGGGVALVNMASMPVRATAVEAAVSGGAGPTAAAAAAAEGLDPPSDLNASTGFRRHLASVLVRRALEEVAATGDAR